MKRMLLIALLICALALSVTACASRETPAEPQGSEAGTQIANPWRDVTEEEATALCPNTFRVPDGAENVVWSVMESGDGSDALVQMSFDLNGLSYVAREQVTAEPTDISGMCYGWTAQLDEQFTRPSGDKMDCTSFRFIGDDEYADLCTWYDADAGVSYSLGVTAPDLDGFDLIAIVEAIAP